MKILLLSDNYPPRTGGSARWFWEIYRRMPRECVVIAAGEDPRQEAFDRTHDLSMERMPLTLPTWGMCNRLGFSGYFRLWKEIGRLARRRQIQQIHCGRSLPEGWIAWLLKRARGIPYICYVHGEDLNLGNRSRELGWMIRRVLRAADFLIANSRNTASLLTGRWQVPEKQVRVMHPGVDVERFVPAPRDADVRTALGWKERPVVLTAGRLQKRKGQDVMIRAVSAIRKDVPDVLYSIVGDGEERQRLEMLVKEHRLEAHVEFRGEAGDRELIQCYQQCDLFVLPNREVEGDIEGFGMVLAEAQACGKPVIAGASGGTAEAMRIPESGRVLACDGPDELARVAAEWLHDPLLCARMGEAGRQWVVERLGWESLSRQACALFFGESPREKSDPEVALQRSGTL